MTSYRKLENARIIRETEKAALIEFEVGQSTGRGTRRQVWFPASHIRVCDEYVAASAWIVGEKARELGINHLMLAFIPV